MNNITTMMANAMHYDKNFDSFTSVWDLMLGTAHFPKNEWPDTGLADIDEPNGLREYLWRPFLAQYSPMRSR